MRKFAAWPFEDLLSGYSLGLGPSEYLRARVVERNRESEWFLDRSVKFSRMVAPGVIESY